jgi:hypothetical protein
MTGPGKLIALVALLLGSACDEVRVELDPGWNAGDAGDAGDADAAGDAGDAGDSSDAGDGGEADLDDEIPSLSCLGFTPAAISSRSDAEVVLRASGARDGDRCLAIPDGGDDPVDLGPLTVAADGSLATVSVESGTLTPGRHVILVARPEGTEAACPGLVLVLDRPPPRVRDVVPDGAWTGDPDDGVASDQSIGVTGEGFLATPAVLFIASGDPAARFVSPVVDFFDTGQLGATCPCESAAMPAGEYHVVVQDPDGLEGRWEVEPGEPGIFRISDVPPPRIDDVAPLRSPAADRVELTISGAFFQPGATVSLGLRDGLMLGLATTGDEERPDAVLHAVIPVGSLTSELGAHPVWVTNPDGRRGVFFSYEATASPEGHLKELELLDVELTTPRERLALELGFDRDGRTVIYAAGGVDDDGTVLDDVEMARLGVFGDPEAPHVAEQYLGPATPRGPNLMNVPRGGLTLVRAGRWIFAIGGSDIDTNVVAPVSPSLASVERAAILGDDEVPLLDELTVDPGDGSIPVGSWSYRVSALGPWGEGLPSPPALVHATGGVVTLCWHEIEGATAYAVYRSPDALGLPGSERLIAGEVVERCFRDDGTGSGRPAPGRLFARDVEGSGLDLGAWTYRVTAVVDGVETVAGIRASVVLDDAARTGVELRWDPVPGATYTLYRSRSASARVHGDDQTFLLVTGLRAAEYRDTGTRNVDRARPAPDGVAVLPRGSLSRWELLDGGHDLVTPREGLDGVAFAVPDEPGSDRVTTFIYVAGGRPDSTGIDTLATVERARVEDGGELGPWEVMSQAMVQPRAFLALLTTAGQGATPRPPPWPATVPGPLVLVACQGDDRFDDHGAGNEGTISIEVASVREGSGDLDPWVLQADGLPSGQATLGHDAALFFDFLYVFKGVRRESRGSPPDPFVSPATRFEVHADAPVDAVIVDPQSTSAGFQVPRAYYGLVRVPAFLFVVGGNDGHGAISSIERVHQ